MPQQLPIEQYANLLYKYIKAYNFPGGTYNFIQGGMDNNYDERNNPFKYEFKNPHNKYNINGDFGNYNINILGIEQYINEELFSEEHPRIKNGLLNIIYWGNAYMPPFQYSGINNLINRLMPDGIDRFQEFIDNDLSSKTESKLIKIWGKDIPYFHSGIAFVSKLLMFLNPMDYPVLDKNIAKKCGGSSDFPPLQNLKIDQNSIPINNPNNVDAYESWACWCRKIAKMVTDMPKTPCNDLRAVDVERAIYMAVKHPSDDLWSLLTGLEASAPMHSEIFDIDPSQKDESKDPVKLAKCPFADDEYILNRARIDKILYILREDLLEYVEQKYLTPQGNHKKILKDYLYNLKRNSPRHVWKDFASLHVSDWDVITILDMIMKINSTLFTGEEHNKFDNGNDGLRQMRNDWAHQKSFNINDTNRVLTLAIDLLSAISRFDGDDCVGNELVCYQENVRWNLNEETD